MLVSDALLALARLLFFLFCTRFLIGVIEDSIRACVAEDIAPPKEKKEESESKAGKGDQQLGAEQHAELNLQGRECPSC